MKTILKLVVIAIFIKHSQLTEKNSTRATEGNGGGKKNNTSLNKDNCTTVDGIKGYCIQLHLCRPILDILPTDKRPLSSEVLEILELITCGNDDNSDDFKVCCPGKRLSRNPPDVTKHKNLKFLPKRCGHVEVEDRVIGGSKAALFEFTWMAQISYNTARGVRFKCAGSIINTKYILTAAHCLANLKNRTLNEVTVGEYDTSTDQDCEYYPDGEKDCADPVLNLTIDKVVVHPNFNEMTLFHDIGLLKVKETMDFKQNNIGPICLPIYKDLRQQKLKNGIVTGWGRDETNKRNNILHKVSLNMVEPHRCRSIYRNFQMIISYQQMCAGDTGKDACDGDSGGPLQMMANYNGDVRYVQFGIVSYGPSDCGKKHRPGVYINLVHYTKWILDNIEE